MSIITKWYPIDSNLIIGTVASFSRPPELGVPQQELTVKFSYAMSFISRAFVAQRK